jgi:Outer membrane protein beta-barrel domain
MRMHLRYVPVALAVLTFSVPALAQQADAHVWGRGTTLTAFAGTTVDTEPLAGGSLGWELTPRLALEGSGLWVDDDGGDGFAGSLTLQAALRAGRRTVPYVQAGVGLYRLSVDRDDAPLPHFYRRRMVTGTETARTFTDPSLVFGGGVNLFVSRNVALRPDAQIMMVMGDSRSHFVTALRMSLVYHIEDHPVTPARRSPAALRARTR